MSWQSELIEKLTACPYGGYGAADSAATEPSALSGLALAASGRSEAILVADWIAGFQSHGGSVGVRPSEIQPAWPTSLAVLLWSALDTPRFENPIARGVRWILDDRGLTFPRTAESGHDSTLEAWSWVSATHSWVEPTAFNLLALHAVGQGTHPRSRAAVKMLFDRQLPSGGFNYGNTTVFDAELPPHVQPTALALLALRNAEPDADWLKPSIEYLRRELTPNLTCFSLCWSLLALAAYDEPTHEADRLLEVAFRRVLRGDDSLHKLALLALAMQRARQPLFVHQARTCFFENHGSTALTPRSADVPTAKFSAMNASAYPIPKGQESKQ